MKTIFVALALLAATPAVAEIHEVQMFNRNDRGPMIYEPNYLEIARRSGPLHPDPAQP